MFTVYSRGCVIPIQRPLHTKNCLKVPRNNFKSLTYVETLCFCKLVNVRVFNIYHMHELSYLKVKGTSGLLENIRLCYRLKHYAMIVQDHMVILTKLTYQQCTNSLFFADRLVMSNNIYSIIFILFAPSWTQGLDFLKHIPFSSKFPERLAF